MSDELLSLLSRSVENPTARTPLTEPVVLRRRSPDELASLGLASPPVVPPDRQAWLDERRQGIGGSDIAALLGLDPFRGALDVWIGKVEGWDAPETEDMIRGQVLEPGVLDWYARRLGVEVRPNTNTWTHATRSLCRCTVDAFADVAGEPEKVVRLVSVKCPRRGGENWGDYDGSTRIPQNYAMQLQFEDAVSRGRCAELGGTIHPVFHLAALVDGDLRIYNVERDEELQAVLLEQAEQWWERHVVARVPPELDGSDGARAWIRRRFPTSTNIARRRRAAAGVERGGEDEGEGRG